MANSIGYFKQSCPIVDHDNYGQFLLTDFSFMCMYCRSLFVLFLVAIVLSVFLRFMDSDYPFGILDLWILITSLVS